MLRLASIFLFFAMISESRAAVVTYDIGGSLQTEQFQPGCYCNSTITFFAGTLNGVHAGDTVDLGEVKINAQLLNDRYGSNVIQGFPFFHDDVAYSAVAVEQFKISIESYGYQVGGGCEIDLCFFQGKTYTFPEISGLSSTYKLSYGAPGDNPFLVIGWVGPAVYFSPSIAAVPEPATWAMMLLGFGAVVGFVSHRHRRPAFRGWATRGTGMLFRRPDVSA